MTSFILVVLSTFLINSAIADEPIDKGEDYDEWFTRRQKTVLLNVGIMGGIVVHGLINWDYGEDPWHFDNEGWFGRTTKYGGMDKLGHFWSSYAGSHLLSYIYREWDYSDDDANLYGAMSAFGIQSFMEIADGFSGHGFSYEDWVANLVGCGVGYFWGKYPKLDEKIDFRIEYHPDFSSDDLDPFTNYENQRYLMVIKADGFLSISNPILKYGEFHLGYYAHGYKDYQSWKPDDDRKRKVFIGIGFNVTRLIQKWVEDMSVFNYFQIPYTSINFEYDLD